MTIVNPDLKFDEFAQRTSLPVYYVVFAIANYLQSLDFVQQFNGAIYTYPRSDIPNLSLPAILIYPQSHSKTNEAAFGVNFTINIDMLRNIGDVNRAEIYQFHQAMVERILYALCYNNEFRGWQLGRNAPFITMWGNTFSSDYHEDENLSRISIDGQYWFPAYRDFLMTHPFNPDGTQAYYYQAFDFKLSQNPVNEDDNNG
jgi:hypothetical protein